MPIAILVIQGLIEVIGLGAFLSGFFLDISWLMVVGGSLVVLDDIVEVALGVLNPAFPVLLAVVLAFIFTPWYVGVFWASAAFKVFGIPAALTKIFAPKQLISMRRHHLWLDRRGRF